MEPSQYQKAALDWACNQTGNAVLEAVAGSGKSTLLQMLCEVIPGTVGAFAFAKDAKAALDAKIRHLNPRVQAQTTSSLGFQAIKAVCPKSTLDEDKYKTLARPHIQEITKGYSFMNKPLSENMVDEIVTNYFPIGPMHKLLALARLNLLECPTDEQLWDIVDHHSLEIPDVLAPVVFDLVCQLIHEGLKNLLRVDYTDMLSVPGLMKLKPRQFDWVLVDECQDLNRAQHYLVINAIRPGGRILSVGDRRQAIFGFAGADSQSFQFLIDETRARCLPLSICYRCPVKVVEEAKRFCPQIEAAPGAAEGAVLDIPAESLAQHIQEGDMILCRVNAPLLGTCYDLIASGVPAVVRGRDIETGLQNVVKAATKLVEGSFKEGFQIGMDKWLEAAKVAAVKKGGSNEKIEARFDQLQDRYQCVMAVWSRLTDCDSPEGLCQEIKNLFNQIRPKVVLSSIHKAKGLEAPNVFILQPELLESPRAKKPWQLEQEHNLFYVAITRAQKCLYYCRSGV